MVGDIGDTGDAGDCVALWRLSNTRSNGDCSSADDFLRIARLSAEILGHGYGEFSSSSIMPPPLGSEYWLRLEVECRKNGAVLISDIDEELPFLVTTMLLSYELLVILIKYCELEIKK